MYTLFEISIFSQNLECRLVSEYSLRNLACGQSKMAFMNTCMQMNNIQKQFIYTAAAEITRILTQKGLASALSIEKIERTNFALLFTSKCIAVCSGGSSVSQNKLPQLILGYIYILKHLQSNFIG